MQKLLKNRDQLQSINPPILFLHGVGASSRQWQGVLEALQRKMNFSPLLLDLPGHGSSDQKLQKNTDAAVEHLIEYIQNKRIQTPIYFVGHSLGGLLGLKLALKVPNILSKMIVINSSSQINLLPDFVSKLLKKSLNKEEVTLFFNKKIDALLIETVLNDFNELKVGDSADDFMDLKNENLNLSLPKIKIPVLSISCKQDSILSPRKSSELSKNLCNGSLIKLQEGGALYPP